MKKVILSFALIAGMTAMANIQTLQAANRIQTEVVAQDENGFVEVKLEELTPEVQEAVKAMLVDYDLKMLKYNAEKQLTKVVLTSKQDQSEKKVLLDAQGKEVSKDSVVKEEPEKVEEQQP
ncbi:MAG: hypothetical protein XD92_1325 [Proteiniphilum acetatigenes]|uniref:Uncharacterized protein n=1 Tax=Proteiniphilum acetatigenes TaxID=294710 RepID=A0A101HG06_9BACT|nr:MAG: hypothetical protein XD92_1325 [Proteiniphilum acetatigenes]